MPWLSPKPSTVKVALALAIALCASGCSSFGTAYKESRPHQSAKIYHANGTVKASVDNYNGTVMTSNIDCDPATGNVTKVVASCDRRDGWANVAKLALLALGIFGLHGGAGTPAP